MIADRFSNKTVLRLAGQLFLLCLVGWVFTGNPGSHAWTLPMLVGIHIVMGIATAGVTLASSSIALKLSPPGQATAFLAVNTVITALAGGIAPIVGGLFADVFATRELGITIHWMSPVGNLAIPALNMRHWQFFFGIAVVTGLFALTRLRLVRERGDAASIVVIRRAVATTHRDLPGLVARLTERVCCEVGKLRPAANLLPKMLLTATVSCPWQQSADSSDPTSHAMARSIQTGV